MIRRVLRATLFVLAAAWGGAGLARADDPPPVLGEEVERPFLEGRLETVEGFALSRADEPTRRELERILAAWRPRLPAPPAPPPAAERVSLPLIEALLAERDQRETRGLGRLPEGSPLAALPDPHGALKNALELQRWIYRFVPDEDNADPQIALPARQQAATTAALEHRALAWAAGAAGLILLLTLLAGWRLGGARALARAPGTRNAT